MFDEVNAAILTGALLVVISIFTSLLAKRVGVPLLLLFLALGLLAGEDGIGHIDFDNASLAYFVGSIALAVILFDSGFDTPFHSFRVAAGPAATLASAGTLLTAAAMGAATRYLLDCTWPESFLLGSIVASTDAAAVFLLLRLGGMTIRDRVRSTLVIESGSNDPMAILLTIALVDLIAAGAPLLSWTMVVEFAGELLIGAAAGTLGGLAITRIVNRVELEESLYPLLTLALALGLFALTGVIGGSGFLAVYIAGLITGNARVRSAGAITRFQGGMTWLGQIVMFVTLGLLATPSTFPQVLGPALAAALFLIFVARPIVVWLCLAPFRFTRNDTAFIAWVGLRGSVSILLAIVPIIGGLPIGQEFFNAAFIIVLTSLIVQGWTIRPVARRLGLLVPPRLGPLDRVELALPGEAEVELVAYTIDPKSPVAQGHRLPRWARPALILRDGQTLDVRTARGLAAGDHVYLFTVPSRIPLLDRLFAGDVELSEEDRDFYGDFALNGDSRLGALAEQYGLEFDPADFELTLAGLFARHYGDVPEPGDRLRYGGIELIVRDAEESQVTRVGLNLDPPTGPQSRLPIFQNRAEILAALRRLWTWLSGRGAASM